MSPACRRVEGTVLIEILGKMVSLPCERGAARTGEVRGNFKGDGWLLLLETRLDQQSCRNSAHAGVSGPISNGKRSLGANKVLLRHRGA